MLTALSTQVSTILSALLRRLRMPLLALLLALSLSLQSCGSGSQPPRGVLLQALGLQIQLTQARVAAALQLEPAGVPEVARVRIEQQEAIPIGDGRGLHLSGRFDWRLADDPIRVDSAFDLYLLRGERGQSWRLARPVGSDPDGRQQWISDPLPLKGEQPLVPVDSSPASGTTAAGSSPAAAG
jgi:hypothetical protein